MSHFHQNNAAGKIMDGAFSFGGPFQHLDLDEATLLRMLWELLDQGIHGLCFSAYAPGQSPAAHDELTEGQVRERLAMIAPHTKWIRTFSCMEGNQLAPSIAHEMGMKTLVGAWIDGDAERNETEIAAVIELARQGHADLVAIGNEVLLRGEMSDDELIGLIRRVKEAVPDVPVGYVDAYFVFAQRPALVEACDFLPINCYPFWEKCPLEHSLGYVGEMVRQVAAASQGKPVIIAETGWPTDGPPEGGAVPGLANMARYALNLIPWAAAQGIPLFWFSAFDEAWKVGAEGDCGAYWGFWDANGGRKGA